MRWFGRRRPPTLEQQLQTLQECGIVPRPGITKQHVLVCWEESHYKVVRWDAEVDTDYLDPAVLSRFVGL